MAIWSSNPTHEHISRETHIGKCTCTLIFTAALFTIAKTWERPTCPMTEKWIKKMWYIYTIEYYSAIKKKVRMPFAATWVDLEIIMLNKKSEKGKYHMISFVFGIYKLKKRHKWSNFQKINWPIDFANKRTAAKGESWARSLKLTNSHYYV